MATNRFIGTADRSEREAAKKQTTGMTADRAEREAAAKKTTTTKPTTTRTTTTKPPPISKTKVQENRTVALGGSTLPATNPYAGLQTGLQDILTTTTGNLQTDLDRVSGKYNEIRNQILATYGNTNNQALINARDLALGELNRQADDATRQVAANYQAAQARQAEFSNRQLALAQQAAQQQQMLTNVAAGNIAAWNQQFGTTDGQAADMAALLAERAPREAALAQALGATAAGYETAMGTSIGEQQMAIQGQIARDLAARSGTLTSQTARDIAAAEMADRARLDTALLDLGYRQLGAEEGLRSAAGERTLALQQAIAEAGLGGGLFAVSRSDRAEDIARARAAAASEAALKKEMFEYEKGITERELGLKERALAVDEAKALGEQPTVQALPPQAKTLADWVRTKKGTNRGPDASVLEFIGYTLGDKGFVATGDQALLLIQQWNTLSPDTLKDLRTQGINSLDDYANRYLKSTPGASSPARQTTSGTPSSSTSTNPGFRWPGR